MLQLRVVGMDIPFALEMPVRIRFDLFQFASSVGEEETGLRAIDRNTHCSVKRAETYCASVCCDEFLRERKIKMFHIGVTAVFYLQSTRLSVGQPTPYLLQILWRKKI